jgi:signal-transduction protein with cAMP-binding, CBS, and nucleotidyltransferase domain
MSSQSKNLFIDTKLLSKKISRTYEELMGHMKIEIFQEQDVILKKGEMNSKVYFIIEGIVEVTDEEEDYQFYDIEETSNL